MPEEPRAEAGDRARQEAAAIELAREEASGLDGTELSDVSSAKDVENASLKKKSGKKGVVVIGGFYARSSG